MAVKTRVNLPSSADVTTEAVATAVALAVANWAEESNGRIESRAFDFAAPLDPPRSRTRS
jgi:hypothetical protein